MNRTLPFTVWIAAFDATGGLAGGIPLIEIGIYFVEFPDPFRCWFFGGIGALHLQKLEYVGHEPVCSVWGESGFDKLTYYAHVCSALQLRLKHAHYLTHILD